MITTTPPSKAGGMIHVLRDRPLKLPFRRLTNQRGTFPGYASGCEHVHALGFCGRIAEERWESSNLTVSPQSLHVWDNFVWQYVACGIQFVKLNHNLEHACL